MGLYLSGFFADSRKPISQLVIAKNPSPSRKRGSIESHENMDSRLRGNDDRGQTDGEKEF
jgi:hypothetical protein